VLRRFRDRSEPAQPGLAPSKNVYGVAVDLGTTTIVGTLFDLAIGQEKAVSTAMNPQVSFGDDVISRKCSRRH